MDIRPKLLLQEQRNDIVELQFYGYIIHCDSQRNITYIGNTHSYPFFQRSCAKPLQASVMKQFGTEKFYSLTDKEIAICCASHTGEPIHTTLIKNLLQKADLSENDLLCPAIEPLNKSEQKKFNTYSKLHNNCSGKHTLMLLICRQMGWDINTYLDRNHPLQLAIYKQIQNLCECDKRELPYTLDGCTAPIYATSLEELAKGFYNVFCTENYLKIKNAFLNNPYLIGGQDRPDTQIMQINQKLIAKAGAGGVLCIVNTEINEVLVVKVTDADMKARSIIALDAMLEIGWLNKNSINQKLLINLLDKNVKTETGEIVGKYISVFDKNDFSNRMS